MFFVGKQHNEVIRVSSNTAFQTDFNPLNESFAYVPVFLTSTNCSWQLLWNKVQKGAVMIFRSICIMQEKLFIQ